MSTFCNCSLCSKYIVPHPFTNERVPGSYVGREIAQRHKRLTSQKAAERCAELEDMEIDMIREMLSEQEPMDVDKVAFFTGGDSEDEGGEGEGEGRGGSRSSRPAAASGPEPGHPQQKTGM